MRQLRIPSGDERTYGPRHGLHQSALRRVKNNHHLHLQATIISWSIRALSFKRRQAYWRRKQHDLHTKQLTSPTSRLRQYFFLGSATCSAIAVMQPSESWVAKWQRIGKTRHPAQSRYNNKESNSNTHITGKQLNFAATRGVEYHNQQTNQERWSYRM